MDMDEKKYNSLSLKAYNIVLSMKGKIISANEIKTPLPHDDLGPEEFEEFSYDLFVNYVVGNISFQNHYKIVSDCDFYNLVSTNRIN
jgi:hypothetical protein